MNLTWKHKAVVIRISTKIVSSLGNKYIEDVQFANKIFEKLSKLESLDK